MSATTSTTASGLIFKQRDGFCVTDTIGFDLREKFREEIERLAASQVEVVLKLPSAPDLSQCECLRQAERKLCRVRFEFGQSLLNLRSLVSFNVVVCVRKRESVKSFDNLIKSFRVLREAHGNRNVVLHSRVVPIYREAIHEYRIDAALCYIQFGQFLLCAAQAFTRYASKFNRRLPGHDVKLSKNGANDIKCGAEANERSDRSLISVQPKFEASAARGALKQPVLRVDCAQRVSQRHPKPPCDHEGNRKQADDLSPGGQALKMHPKMLPLRRLPRNLASPRLHSFARAA